MIVAAKFDSVCMFWLRLICAAPIHNHICVNSSMQAAQGFGMTISFDQFKSIIIGGSKDSSTFSRGELESAFVSLQSHKDSTGKLNHLRFREMMRAFGPKTDQETTRKHLQLMREYTSEANFDFLKLLQALEDEGILTKEIKVKKDRKKPKTPATPRSMTKTPASRRKKNSPPPLYLYTYARIYTRLQSKNKSCRTRRLINRL